MQHQWQCKANVSMGLWPLFKGLSGALFNFQWSILPKWFVSYTHKQSQNGIPWLIPVYLLAVHVSFNKDRSAHRTVAVAKNIFIQIRVINTKFSIFARYIHFITVLTMWTLGQRIYILQCAIFVVKGNRCKACCLCHHCNSSLQHRFPNYRVQSQYLNQSPHSHQQVVKSPGENITCTRFDIQLWFFVFSIVFTKSKTQQHRCLSTNSLQWGIKISKNAISKNILNAKITSICYIIFNDDTLLFFHQFFYIFFQLCSDTLDTLFVITLVHSSKL